MTGRDIVQSYIDRGLQIVTWPGIGNEWKGPRETNWQDKKYTIDDYQEGHRVGIMHGVEMSPGRFVVDVDIDYGPGVEIAKALLPSTQFVWGRASKRVSHCLYTCPDIIPAFAYKDIGKDGRTLIEFRANKHQVMAPPSVWEKEGKREPLEFVVANDLTFIDSADRLKQRVCYSAIGMLLGIHLGHNGFGHEVRLAWAGYLLRLGVSAEDLTIMGHALSKHCNNTEVGDVKLVIDSTVTNLKSDTKKVMGGPALAKLIGANGKAVVTRINEWIGRDLDFQRNKEGQIIPKSQENIRRAVEMLGYSLSYDRFADKLLINGHHMEDHEVEHIYFMIDHEHHFLPPWDFFQQKIRHLAWQNDFHPVKDYLKALEWDGTPRVNEWLITSAGVEDTEYTRSISAILLIAAVRRIYHPGAKFDELVVWESTTQGVGKSSAAQALCPKPEWFSDDLALNLSSQKLIEATLGKWIIEVSELSGKRKTEQEQLKAMLSRQVDGPARMAYGRFPVERPRHWVLIGTTNSLGYLADATGGRRWWPVKTDKFNIPWIVANRDQLWAEAAVREAAGESIRLPERLWPIAAGKQEERREADPWEDQIRSALLQTPANGDGRKRVPTDSLFLALGIPIEKRDRYMQTRISDIVQRFGFSRTRVRNSEGVVVVGYAQDLDKLGLLAGDEDDASIPPNQESNDVDPQF